MTRDKLITVRIEEDLRNAFNQWTKDHDTDASTVLYDFIKRCLDGTIDANLATGKTVIGLDGDRLDKIESAIQGIYARLDAERQRLDERLDGNDRSIAELREGIAGK